MTDTDYEDLMEMIDPPEPPLWIANILLVPGLVFVGFAVGGRLALLLL